MQPTLLMSNKKDGEVPKMEYSDIFIVKSKIDDLALKYDSNPNSLFLAATCITLTKYTNSTKIFIKIKSKMDGNFVEVPLRFDDENRKRTVFDYIANLKDVFSNSGNFHESVNQFDDKPHFTYIFNDLEDDGENYIFKDLEDDEGNYIFKDLEDNEGDNSLIIEQSSNSYVLKFKFDSNKYSFSYIRSFLRSIKRVLDQFGNATSSNIKIEDIALRDEQPPLQYKLKRNPLVNVLLENQALKTPEKIALKTCGKEYTFKQVNDEANRIANALIKRGIQKGSTISFMLARDKTLITTFLGIIKAGCIAIPLDMNYPIERINYIRNNSNSKYIITHESIEGAINPQDLINEGDATFPNVDLKAEDPIFILYTSGSTGNPKGVILTHCGISNLISVHIKNRFKSLLSISSIAFDISEEDILVALTNDKELIFASDDEISDIVLLSDLIERTNPEFVNLTPSRLLSYLQVPEFRQAIKQFKGMGCGGEQFTKNVYESIKEYANIDIYNGYGPLETSLTSNSKKIENPDFITNGKPIFNYVTDVRDIDGKLLPYGVMGELYIGGIGVSKGYLNLEEKTKEAFIHLNSLPYYKSGDYAIQLPSDEIIIKGRVDNQIKLRGQRVDPEEIEQVIVKCPKIQNAVVILHEINSEKHLCAYFTSKAKIDTLELKNYLEKFLASYMIPTFFIQLDKFPETPSGKIDRKSFPKPEINTKKEKPINYIEKTLYNLSKKILKHDNFGVTDNLFKLGFTSLRLMELNSDIYHEFGKSLNHMDLMNNPTIRKLSKVIDENTFTEEIERARTRTSNEYPMSSQQKRLYVLYQKNPTLTNYNLPKVHKLKNPIDVVKLENAVNKIIESEEILRTSLHMKNGEFIQRIHEKRPIDVELIKAEGEADLAEVFLQNIQPFKLETDPLIRIKVIEFNGDTYIFRDMHHAIGDQLSIDLLHENIKNAYYDKLLTTNDVQYKDYTLWVEKQQAMEEDYWKNKEISDYGTLLPRDFKRPLNQTFNGKKIRWELDKKAIEKIARENNTTIYQLLLSQFVVLLNKYTGESTIQIGTVTSGRTHPIFEKTLGMFVNTLPFIQSISDKDSLRETLIKTGEELAKLFANQNFSLEQIIENHKISTNDSYNPLFSIAFIQNTAADFDNDLDWNESKFDLTCTFKNSPSQLTVEFDYNKDLYSFEKINGLLKHYIRLIDNIEENMDKRICDISILSPYEEELILEKSSVKMDIETDPILTSLKKQIKENPSQIILSNQDSSLSYEDFDLKTNSLANYLKDNFNVASGDTVVLLANRSIESVLAFYSILKLNAVYVPINPLTPKKRIKHIIDDVDAKVLLTNIGMDLDMNLDMSLDLGLNMENVDVVDLGQKSLYDYDFDELDLSSQGKLCILHTSGTTGVPKGVQISHENIENFLTSVKNVFYDEDIKIFYHTTNIGFDTHLFEILFSLLNGIQLHIIDENYDFTQIPNDILNKKSIVNTVPSKLKMFFTLANFERIMENAGQLILAGEALSENLVAEIRKDYNPVIFNAYGPCEASIFASIKKVISDKVTIGKANINTQIYILNDEKQLCPIGIPGELCIGGKQLSEGYLNQDDETNKHFIANPFDEGNIYCTGDLAYLDSDYEINFIGRKDSQIKINGQRIEIDEINKQIEKNEEIIQAVTVANSRKTQLHSYVVSDRLIDTDKLLDDLTEVLLPFMLPASIMQIDSIPLNDNGKVDAKRLPQPKMPRYEYVAPSNDIERSLVGIWENVLDVKRVGIKDNFYHLGGDSIKAIRIVSLLQNEGINCNPRDILNYKTPYLIAKHVKYMADESYGAVSGVFDLLPIQNYFFDQINRNDYTQEFVLESAIDLDIDTLERALDELTNLHDMLRARFKLIDGKYLQELLPLDTRIYEFKEYEIKEGFEIAISKLIGEAKDSLDVSSKLIDISLVRYGGKSYLVFVIHHLIVDGVSWSILLDDLTHIYNNLAYGDRISLSRPYSYINWLEDVKQLLENISDDEIQDWAKIDALLDDSDIKGKANRFNFKVDLAYDSSNFLMLSEEEYWGLAISRAYKKTYAKDIMFNRESHGRDESLANLFRSVGWFTSQYPVPVNISGGYDSISLAKDVYALKTAFRDVKNLGLNYSSLVYIADEFEYKHCPVTFNFLSTEFVFENDLFKSVNSDFSQNDDSDIEVYGVDFNISRVDNAYFISGDYPKDTFIDDRFGDFVENIKEELKFIANYDFNDENIVCALSEPQLEVYCNEKRHDMGNAYSTWGIVECPLDKSIVEIKDSIHALIDRHPILKGRILDDGEMPLLICDSYPLIEICDTDDYSTLVKPFDLDKYLARFFILDNGDIKSIVYDVHHVINDATGFRIIENDLIDAFDGNLDDIPDLGFVYASCDSFELKFDASYESAHEFFKEQLANIDEASSLKKDSQASREIVSFPIRGVKNLIEDFAQKNNITVGTFLNAVFAYAYSRFIDSDKVCYNFVEHGRRENYLQDSLGMFARTTPILVDCKKDSVANYLDYFSDLALNSMFNNIYPFRLLEKEFNLNNDVLFEYNLDLNDVSDICDDMIVKGTFKDGFSEFFCVVNDLDDGYVLHVNHSDMFSKDTAIRFVKLYSQILTQIINKEKLENIVIYSP